MQKTTMESYESEPVESESSGRESTGGLSVCCAGGLVVAAAIPLHSASHSSADSNLLLFPSQPP